MTRDRPSGRSLQSSCARPRPSIPRGGGHRCGHDRRPFRRRRPARIGRRPCQSGAHPALPTTRVEHDPAEIWSLVAATLAEVAGRLAAPGESPPPSASPTNERRWWPGTAGPGARCIGRSSGRTAGLRSTATRWSKQATCPSSGSGPAWSSIPISRPRRCAGCSDRGVRPLARAGPRNGRRLGALEPDRGHHQWGLRHRRH